MVVARDVLASLTNMGITVEARGHRVRYRPTSAMTPDLLSAVKSCKAELLELLLESANGPEADAEWARFLVVAVPTSDGNGLFDPTQEQVPVGVPGVRWDAFVRDCGRMGRGGKT